MGTQRFIVQSLIDYTFLYPAPHGDIGYCERIDHAGLFDSFEDAQEAGNLFIGYEYVIFSVGGCHE